MYNRNVNTFLHFEVVIMKKSRIFDEMEKAILLKSVLCAWVSLEIGLLVFTFVYSVARQTFDLISAIPLVMAIMSLVVFFIEKTVLTKELTKSEDDDNEE